MEALRFFGPLFLIVFGMMGAVVWGVKGIAEYECNQYGLVAGLETRHVGLETCMINDPEYGWISYEERKMTRVAERAQ